MKKLISAFLILVMLFSVVCVSNSAAEGIYIQSDFSSMEAVTRDFGAGAFYIDPDGSGLLYGYSEAQAFQTHADTSPKQWSQYDTSVEMAIADDDMTDYARHISVVYCNIELEAMGRYEGTYYISYAYDAENQQLTLCGESLSVNEENMLMDPVPMELEDGKFYTYGMSVTKGRIRCFLDGELIFDFVDAENELLLCHDELPVPLVVWNDGNFVQIKDVKISSPGFLFPFAPETSETETTVTETSETTQGGEENVTTQKQTSETTTKIVEEVITNDIGETEIVTKIDTEATTTTVAPADTNTNKPAGGSSTATGDSTFVVVAAMVAAIGCALIVKKVNAD